MEGSGGHLYHVDEVPHHFKEPFLMTGYRSPKSSAYDCMVSIFKPTNETMNFWTHFVFALYFWWKMYRLCYELDLIDDPFLWPMLAYMITLCIFPIASAIAHVFNTMSDHARHLCFMFDYIALSLYSLGAAIAYKAYVFPEDWMESIFDSAFLYIAFFNALMCMYLSSKTRFMQPSKTRKVLRFAAFAVPYLFDCIPLVYRVLWCRPEDCSSDGLQRHVRQFVYAATSAFLYTTHLPERWYPGRFDVFFHSHQLFHIFSSLGANDQMEALLIDLKVRKISLEDHHMIPSFFMSIGSIVCVAVVDCLIMLFFSVKLYQVLPPKPEEKKVEEIETNHNYAEDLTNHRLRRKYAQNGTKKPL